MDHNTQSNISNIRIWYMPTPLNIQRKVKVSDRNMIYELVFNMQGRVNKAVETIP